VNRAGDIRVDEIMPQLNNFWLKMPFEYCLIEKGAKYKKLKKKDMKSSGKIPIIDQGEEYISGYTNEESNSYTGDLPVIIFGDHTRRVKFIDFKFAVGADGTKIFHPFEALHPKFFFYYLNCLRIKSQGYSRHYRFLKQIEVPIPSFNEQKRIVVKLEKLLAKVEKCKERLEKIPTILSRFRQFVLASAFSGDLTADWREKNPDIETALELLKKVKKEQKKRYDEDCVTAKKEGRKKPKKPAILGTNKYCQYESIETWVQLKVDYAFLQGNLFDGPFGSNLKTSDYTNNGVRVIRLENIGFLTFVENKKVFISMTKYESLKKHTVKEGDLIFASFVSENVRAVVLPHIETAIAKADCFCLRPISRLINSKYLAFVLSSSQIYNELNRLVHGATRPRINTTQLKNLDIPLPPLKEQDEIVRRVEAFFKIADQIEARCQKAKAHVEKLTQSILAKAFRGELVPQDPSDPPASELLKQIKAEREKQRAELKVQKNPKRKTKRKRKKKT
jgi:type I restriction enzyme S subunit